MKFTVAAVAALAAGAQASYAASNVTYVTEVVTAYTTYCPAATELTYGGKTYTVSEVSRHPACSVPNGRVALPKVNLDANKTQNYRPLP
jgi:hypothetical protein